MPGGPRGALVDEINGDSICDQIPLPHGHGSVNFRFSMIPSSLKFQVSPATGCAGSYRKETWIPSPMILVSNPSRAVTVKERDPIIDRGMR